MRALLLLASVAAAAVQEDCDSDDLVPLTEEAEAASQERTGPDLGLEAKEDVRRSAEQLKAQGLWPDEPEGSGVPKGKKRNKKPPPLKSVKATSDSHIIQTTQGTLYVGTDPNKALKMRLIHEEFDPTSREGALFQISGIDMHAGVARTQRERQEGRSSGQSGELADPADKSAVREMFARNMEKLMEGVDDYSGMRELRASILGSGNMEAIDTGAFRKFEEVVCADVQHSISQQGVGRQTGEDWDLHRRFTYYREDVTGLIPSFRWRCENLFGVADDPEEAYQLLRDYFTGDKFLPEHLKYTKLHNATMRYVPRSDVIVINLLLQEIGVLFVNHLASELDRLKSHRWPGAGSDIYRKLGEGGSAVIEKVTTYLIRRILKLIRKRVGRTVIVVMSLGRTVEHRQKADEEKPFSMVRRREHNDHQWIDMLLEADFGDPKIVAEDSAQWTAARWKRGETQHWREEEIHLTAISYGQDVSQREWLNMLSKGGYNPFGSDDLWGAE
eukprot:TRINITY_DN10884_c1_g1_i1.p1 TRINITY_DN10884_c1_g1~~TRINITY_DN10884_c1_g1_i1.p1  ORF type:complete len:501 (+),score=160.49 TRINITY_DN10884_c1_g1_i1:64-1566(+)